MMLLWLSSALASSLAVGSVQVAGQDHGAGPDTLRARVAAALAAGGMTVDPDAAWHLDAALAHVERRSEAPTALEVTVHFELRGSAGSTPTYALDARGLVRTADWTGDALTSGAVELAVESLLGHPRFQSALAEVPKAAVATSATAHLARCGRGSLALPSEMPKVVDAVVVVEQGQSGGSVIGTGVFVSPDGWIVTAAHVVSGTGGVTVRLKSGAVLAAEVVRADAQADVALLKVDAPHASCLDLGLTMPDLGAELFVVGTPAGLDYSVSKGIVSSVRTVEGRKLLQTDAPISPGSSGGPILDASGHVRALVRSKLEGDGLEGLGFGTPAAELGTALGVTFAETSDPVEALRWAAREAHPADVVDAADPSTLDALLHEGRAAEKVSARRKSGLVLGGIGAAAVVGSWAWASSLDHSSDAGWTALTVLNTAGWLSVAGGATLVGLSFAPAPGGGAVAAVGTF